MDREQEEMQFLGLFDIYIESYKVIYRCRKIFSQITLSLVLPLAIIFLAQKEVSQLIFSNLTHTESQLENSQPGSPRYQRLSDHLTSDFAALLLFKFVYLTCLIVFSLLSTSAVVYTVACVYTARDLSFRKVMSVVPKVWKRLMLTFLSTFLVFFVYNIVATASLVIWFFLALSFRFLADIPLWVGVAVYTVGLLYMSIIWQLANTVSVLEDSYGFKAMSKSKHLLKGKMVLGVVFFLKLHLALFLVNVIFKKFVVDGPHFHLGMLGRVGFGLLCLLVLFKLVVFGLVTQTVIYFVCKSYHHENIDKSALSNHLEVYLGEYVPLKSKDVQLEQYQV
ncbi:uncharacterized protein LOC116018765 [Ipomoea triloba]|uniref:uncharacterized protein LOC116018765 n=1 Tax=Ipomoea triloba TaxID=35885 RepID=UPI00125DFB97|nr:uncharacterized protein LOC116018765 [Ipomoea triloba]